jgi:hypothetical protein
MALSRFRIALEPPGWKTSKGETGGEAGRSAEPAAYSLADGELPPVQPPA